MMATAWSQTSKGDMLIGGTAGFSIAKMGDNDAITTITLAPNAGYFVIDRLAVGGGLKLVSEFNDEATITAFGLQPLARYYFSGSGSVRPFGQANFDWSMLKIEDLDAEHGFGFGVGIGADFFFNEHVAFEGILGYDYFKFKNADDASSNLGFRLGVVAFISGEKL
jgi:hypothetical protein